MAARLLLFCALVLPLACGADAADAEADALRAELAEAVAASDWNQTLSLTKRYETLYAEQVDAELLLLRARAELRLDRKSDVLETVQRAEDMHPDDDLRADLNTVAGQVLVHRARELGDDAAWNAAGARLQMGVERGALRADAAYWLVLMQDLGGRSNTSRQRSYAKILFQLEPESERGTKLRSYLEQRGVLP